jgi:hypothetical protein
LRRLTCSATDDPGGADTGRHHAHIWFDDHANDYRVVEAPTVEITDLPAGQHVMHVSLRNANRTDRRGDPTADHRGRRAGQPRNRGVTRAMHFGGRLRRDVAERVWSGWLQREDRQPGGPDGGSR